MLKSGLRIAAINLAVLLALLLLGELLARGIAIFHSCQRGSCDNRFLTSIHVESDTFGNRNIGISRFDEQLGYTPKENFNKVINKPGWDECKVTIDSRGFRSNDNRVPLQEHPRILVVGDSFTFGDQVSNHQTWPSCLERRLSVRVDNGGVFGYGAAQALKRAQATTANQKYDTVILSILVGADFVRDQMKYRSGWPSPAVIQDSQGNLLWADVPDPNASGTKYNPAPNTLAKYAAENSLVLSTLIRLIDSKAVFGDTLAERHPEAASIPEIIDWTLRDFSLLNPRNKIVLLQYDRHYDEAPANQERELIIRALGKYGIAYVDTYDAVRSKPKKQVWNGHHTPLGNEIVCNTLAAFLRHGDYAARSPQASPTLVPDKKFHSLSRSFADSLYVATPRLERDSAPSVAHSSYGLTTKSN